MTAVRKKRLRNGLAYGYQSLALTAFLLFTVADCRAQGMSSAFSDNGRLASPQNEKSAAQRLADLRSARAALHANPASAEVYVSLGVSLQALGENGAAETAFDKALSLSPNLPAALYGKGVQCANKEQWPEAQVLFRRAIGASPDFLPARLELAEMLLRTGDFDGATEELHAALRLDSNNPGTHYGLGLIHLQKGEIEDAVDEFRKALALRLHYLEAKKSLAEALTLQGKWREAADLLSQVVRADPQSDEAVMAYARALDKSGDKAESQAQYDRARQLSREEADSFRAKGECNYGVALRNEGKLTESAAAFRKAMEETPNFCEAHDDLGGVLWQQQDFAGASSAFEAAVRCNPNLASARNNLGIALLYYKHDADHAIEQFRAAIASNPGFTLAHLNLGKAMATKGQFADAELEFQQTIALAPEMAAAHVALGLSLAASTGKLSPEARAEINEGLRLDPALRSAVPQEYAAQLN
jgi:tetratricopeptide (TPR) repeat protein